MRTLVLFSCLAVFTGCSTVEGWLGMDEDEPAAATEPTTSDAGTTATDTSDSDTAAWTDTAGVEDVLTPDPVTPDCDLVPTLASLEDQYFGPSCTFSSCHDSDNPAGALDLSPGNAYDAMVDVAAQGDAAAMLIVPGDPDNSYLVHRVEGTSGVFMPPGVTEALDPECRIATLRAWILAGAPPE